MYKLFQKIKDKILPHKELIRQPDCISTLEDPLFLSPDPNIDGNDDYIHWLDIAINRPTATNIALTGGYGSGKSSILEKFIIVSKYRKRILKISFSTLGANPKDYSPPVDDKGIINEQDGDNNQKSNSQKSEKRFISNIIQKEIVKQLLFKESPSKLPKSKFRRIKTPNTLSSILFASIVDAIISVIYQTFLIEYIFNFTNGDVISSMMLIISVYLSIIVIIMYIIKTCSNININKIGGGPINLSLSSKDNYFDEYLDEIIYFFQATKYRIVIFEDIDRFKDLYIFENLRQLNVIINSSKHNEKNKIKFIYAVKDSIFSGINSNIKLDNTNNITDNSDGVTNRTKFFDLIIPVVPFLTHENSSKHLSDYFNKLVNIQPIKTVSPYITDMRLIKNIRNEYIIFKNKLIDCSGNILNLDSDKLFAIISYKNIYLEDFENIKMPENKLNIIYREYRKRVSQYIINLDKELADLKNLNGIDVSEDIERFGSQLLSYIENEERQNSSIIQNITDKNGKIIERTSLNDESLWLNISNATDNDNVVTLNWDGYGVYKAQSSHLQKLSKKDIEETVIKAKISINELTEIKQKEINNLIIEKEQLKTNIRFASIKQLLSLELELECNFDENNITFESYIKKQFDNSNDQPTLGYDLIKSGLIDENYMLYYSVYQGNLSKSAYRYKILNIQKNIMDIHYSLNDNDLEELFNDIGESYVDSISMFNIDIITYLLSNVDEKTNILFQHLGSNCEKVLEVFTAYLKSDKSIKNKKKFIKSISKYYSDVLINLIEINPDNLDELIGEVMIGSEKNTDITLSDSAKKYLNANLSSIKPFTLHTKSSEQTINSALEIIGKSDMKIISLDGVNSIAKDTIKSLSLYEININNIKTLFGENGDISLNNLYLNYVETYEYMIKNIADYLSIIDADKTQYTLNKADALPDIIHNIFVNIPDRLDPIFHRADKNKCQVHSILSVPKETWSYLMTYLLVEPNLTNMLEYFSFLELNKGEVTEKMFSIYLNMKKNISLDKNSLEEYDNNEVLKLVIAILNNEVIDLDVKNNILISTYKSKIDITLLDHKDSLIFGMLLSNGHIGDDISSYNYINDLSWSTKYNYMINSKKFSEYVNSITFSQDDILSISSSKAILNYVKESIISDLVKYESEISPEVANNLIGYTSHKSINLSPEHLRILAKGSTIKPFLGLLVSRLDTLSQSETLNILNNLGGEYKKISKFIRQAKLENTPENLRLIEHLINVHVVSSQQSSGNNDGVIRVFMKKPAQ